MNDETRSAGVLWNPEQTGLPAQEAHERALAAYQADKANAKLWHPELDHEPLENSGSFTGGGRKLVLHTGEVPTLAGLVAALRANRSAPHISFDPAAGKGVQHIPFNLAGRSLEHPAGTPETNRANALQIELVGYARDTHEWPDAYYEHLADLCRWLENHAGVPHHCGVEFADTPHRLSPGAYITYAGYLGHENVPSQPAGHWDPGNLAIKRLFHAIEAGRK